MSSEEISISRQPPLESFSAAGLPKERTRLFTLCKLTAAAPFVTARVFHLVIPIAL